MNRVLLILMLLLTSNFIYGQQADTANAAVFDPRPTVITTAKFDKYKATKEGYYFSDYVMNISAKQAKKLHGKMLKVTGKVDIIKGIKDQPKKNSQNHNEVIVAGRLEDTKYIPAPHIEILPH